MADPSDITVYEYPGEVLVEILGSDEFGEVTAVTYQFSYVDSARQAVTADQTIDDAHVEAATDALADQGYRLAASES